MRLYEGAAVGEASSGPGASGNSIIVISHNIITFGNGAHDSVFGYGSNNQITFGNGDDESAVASGGSNNQITFGDGSSTTCSPPPVT